MNKTEKLEEERISQESPKIRGKTMGWKGQESEEGGGGENAAGL